MSNQPKIPGNPTAPGGARSSYPSGPLIIMKPARQGEPNTPSGLQPTVRTLPSDGAPKAAETSARRLPDVYGDVQQTSPRASTSEEAPASSIVPVGNAPLASSQQGRQPDVNLTSAKSAALTDPLPRSPRQSQKPKRQAGQDASGRFRHTLRLEPKAEQKLRAIADALGVDLNAAISVCISEKYHRLLKAGGGEG